LITITGPPISVDRSSVEARIN